jgi:amino acid transporter
MNGRKIARIVCVSFLWIGALLSVLHLVFAVGMEGMRHSRPGPDQFDSYYWVPVLHVVLSFFWLMSAVMSATKTVVVFLTCVASVLSVWWVSLMSSDDVEIAMVGAVFVALSFLASWGARGCRPTESNEFKRA